MCINTCKIHFSEDIKQIATSIKKETGIDIDREKIISKIREKQIDNHE